MPANYRDEVNGRHKMGEDPAESAALLAATLLDDEEEEAATHSKHPRRPLNERRQSSISKPPPNGQPRTPRTANRVRFNIEDRESSNDSSNEHFNTNAAELDQGRILEDDNDSAHRPDGYRSNSGQRAPLLTDVEAPSITVASSDVGFNMEDLLETARPKSGMRSAFMNMANSIM